MSPVRASDILTAIRKKYPKLAVVREVVIRDELQTAIYNRHRLDGSRGFAWAGSFERSGAAIADSVPEGWDPATAKFERRIDALMLNSGQRTAIEIKVTLADFRRDNDEKRRAWREHTHRFVYAAPAGLIDPGLIPPGCGLWELDPATGTLTATKKAAVALDPLPLPDHVVAAMFYRVSNYERKSEPRMGRP